MINAEQIRAARALLDWSTADLAKQAGLTVNGINKIERGHVQAHRDTLETIQKIFEGAGLEFLDFSGTRLRPEGLQILKGEEGMRRFFDNVYAYAQTTGGIIRQNGIEDEVFFAAETFGEEHSRKMTALRNARKNFIVRVLVQEGSGNFKCPQYAEYKWFPRTSPMPVPYYTYGDIVGIFALDKQSLPEIYQITSSVIATAYIKQFDSAWNLAENPSTTRRGQV